MEELVGGTRPTRLQTRPNGDQATFGRSRPGVGAIPLLETTLADRERVLALTTPTS